MLFDGPPSAPGPEPVGDVPAVIRQLTDDGMTMLVVTHEIGFAQEAAGTAVFRDDGTVVEAGKSSEVLVGLDQERTRAFLSKVL